MRMRLRLCVLLLALASKAGAQTDSLERNQVVGAVGAQLDAALTRFAEYGFSGTVLVVQDRKIVLVKGYGLADATRGVRNSAATRFEMNSMTKMFTGVAILQLAAAGKLHLGDPVERHLGEFPAAKRGATVEQLARHTSGLIVAGTNLASGSRDAFVRDVRQTPREAPPSEQYRYTNAGFSLLAAIIETASGESYETYLRRHFFAPAGMRSAMFREQVPTTDTLFARGYVGTPAALEPGPPNPYGWGTIGAGGVWSTVGDMYRWLVAVDEGSMVAPAQRAILYSEPPPPAREQYGWHVGTVGGRMRIDKGGGSDDFASQMLFYPRERVVIIWASNNLRQRWRQTLNQTLPGVVFGGAPIALPSVANVPRTQLIARAGRYFVGRDTLVVAAAGTHLYVSANAFGVPPNVMFFPQESTHFTGYDPATRAVTRLSFAGEGSRSLVVELADGKRIEARR